MRTGRGHAARDSSPGLPEPSRLEAGWTHPTARQGFVRVAGALRLREGGVALAVAVVVLLSPMAASACPNCYASSDTQVLHTYYFSAFMLTLLPFVIIGGIWLVAKSLRRSHAPESGSAVRATPTAR